jgi:hypothetical protein
MLLLWDGLQVRMPDKMEIAVLDRGFIRLRGRGPETPSVEVRFGPERRAFRPHRDGRRILRAVGLPPDSLKPCRETWRGHVQGDLYTSSERMYLLRFREVQGIVAILFSAPPSLDMVREILASLAWIAPENWRCWRCYDIAFETPPGFGLVKAVFHPGRYCLSFAANRSVLLFDRLAPADIVLDAAPLDVWSQQYVEQNLGPGIQVIPQDDARVDLVRKPSLLYPMLPWLPGLKSSLRGRIRHTLNDNKILVLAVQGPLLPDEINCRIHDSYATIPSLQT